MKRSREISIFSLSWRSTLFLKRSSLVPSPFLIQNCLFFMLSSIYSLNTLRFLRNEYKCESHPMCGNFLFFVDQIQEVLMNINSVVIKDLDHFYGDLIRPRTIPVFIVYKCIFYFWLWICAARNTFGLWSLSSWQSSEWILFIPFFLISFIMLSSVSLIMLLLTLFLWHSVIFL